MPQEPEVLAGHAAEAAAAAATAAERQAAVQLLLVLPATARRGRLGPVVVRRQHEADGAAAV